MESTHPPAASPSNAPPCPVALVTGAGSGIGRATALMLAREGYRLVLVGREREKLDAVAREIASRSARAPGPVHAGPAVGLALDLATPEACGGAIDTAVALAGRLDVLVNNAGWSPLAPIPGLDAATARRIFEINALAPVYLTLAACQQFSQQSEPARAPQPARPPCIVNVSSRASTDPFVGLGVYGSAKASVNLLALATARECPGVRAFAVAPGAVETPLLRSIFPTDVLPPDRCLSPDDVARVILDCVLGAYDHQNGRTIDVPSP